MKVLDWFATPVRATYTTIAGVVTCIGLILGFWHTIGDMLTKPVLTNPLSEDRIEKPLFGPSAKSSDPKITHRLEFFELQNPGPGALRDFEIDVDIDVPFDEVTKMMKSGGMVVQGNDGLRFLCESNGSEKTTAKGVFKINDKYCELPSGRTLTFKIIGPKDSWKCQDPVVLRSDGSRYKVNDAESRSSRVFVAILSYAPMLIIVAAGVAFFVLCFWIDRRYTKDLEAMRVTIKEEALASAGEAIKVSDPEQAAKALDLVADDAQRPPLSLPSP